MSAPQYIDLARTGATALADSIAVGSAIALVAWVLNLLFRQRSAATRFAVLLAALLATVSLPLLRLSWGRSGTAVANVSWLHVAEAWAPWILSAWAAFAAVALARIVAGIWRLRRLRRSCRRIADGILDGELVGTYCPARKVEFLVSATTTVPAAIGFVHPAVILPEWVLNEMSADELRHVIIHELSHLRRWDDWTNLLQQIVKALLFFHPAVWWMEGRLSLEREMACDDAVLLRSDDPRSYAECLARIAERSFLRRGLAMAQAAVSRVRQTSRRVARILQRDKGRGRTGKLSVAFTVVLTMAGIAVAWRTPLVLSFNNAGPITTAKVGAPSISPTPVLRPIQAAWHEPAAQPRPKPRVRPAVHRTIMAKRSVEGTEARAIPASLTSTGQQVTRTFVVVVMQDGQPVAVWHITTWQYSPSQQVRAARKTT